MIGNGYKPITTQNINNCMKILFAVLLGVAAAFIIYYMIEIKDWDVNDDL